MRRQSLAIFSVIVGSALLLFGFGGKSASPVVAKIGGEKITVAQLEERFQLYPADAQKAVRLKENQEKILDEMINESLLFQAANKEGYAKKEAYIKQLEAVKRKLLIDSFLRDQAQKLQAAIKETDLQAYYNQNQAQFSAQEQRDLSHILLRSPEDAQAILDQIKKGVPFTLLAERYSLDQPTRVKGGRLGFVLRSNLVPEFGTAAFSIDRVGGISPIVRSQFGFHIIRLEARGQRPKVEYAQAKGAIYNLLIQQKQEAMFADILKKAKSDFKIAKQLDNLVTAEKAPQAK